jgi:sugar O-acyltransferase (sialic acid O-acetyltransferase NeuD family)
MKIFKGKTLVIYGAGSLGKEILQLAKNMKMIRRYSRILFIDDITNVQKIKNFDVYSVENFLETKCKDFDFFIAIADIRIRRIAAERLMANFGKPVNLISNKVNHLEPINMGQGNLIFPGTTISVDVKLGDFVIINANSYIGHDCTIGDYVTISPSVTVCGNVEIQNNVFIGAKTSIIQGTNASRIQIGENSILGIGSNVLKSVSALSTWAGNPAKEIDRP